MSLREELLNLLVEQDTEGTDIRILKNNMDEILKLFEKRIDSLKAEMEPTTNDNVLSNLTPLAWNNALNAVKEILK